MGTLIFQLGIPIGFLLLGLIAGKCIEMRHFKALDEREGALQDITICNLRNIPEDVHVSNTLLVCGGVVIATDYFKVFAAQLRNLFGGEIKTYQSLMTRARREALVRMLEDAKVAGADSVWNVRFETSTIQGKQKKKAGGVEVLAYGTAVISK